MNKVLIKVIFIILLLSNNSCKVICEKCKNKSIISNVISASFEPFQPDDSFLVVVLAYSPGNICNNTDTLCSISFGATIPAGEIIEIQSICSADTSIRPGDKLIITPYRYYSSTNWKRNVIYIHKFKEFHVHPLHSIVHKITYAKIKKVN